MRLLESLLLLGSAEGSVVETKNGLIEGTLAKFGDAIVGEYLGIPFAKPPVGKLRFKHPERPESWSEILETKERKPLCSQEKVWEGFTNSEDCLFLDVYTPSEVGWPRR